MDAKYGKACDFRLVSTYVPFVATVVRAQVFIAVVVVVAQQLPANVYAAVLLLTTYFDALLHVGVGSSSLGGHLLPICFMWLTKSDGSTSASEATDAVKDAQLALNVMWFVAVHTLLASYTFRRKFPVTALPILAVNAGLVLCRLWLSAAPVSVLDMHVRSVGFYVFVFTHFYVFQTRSQWDVATHACIGPHVGMHVFFVDSWFVAVSLGCTVFMCARVYLQNQRHHDAEETHALPPRRTTTDAFADVEDMGELLEQLLAAKAGAHT
jgi:hypothetical protein